VVTSCGLLLHLVLGMQLTFVMRTVRTCGLEACLEVVVCGPVFAPEPLGAVAGAVPPAPAAPAEAGSPTRQHSSAEAIAARKDMDRWGALLTKKIPSRR
jgi:hypothetical protein